MIMDSITVVFNYGEYSLKEGVDKNPTEGATVKNQSILPVNTTNEKEKREINPDPVDFNCEADKIALNKRLSCIICTQTLSTLDNLLGHKYDHLKEIVDMLVCYWDNPHDIKCRKCFVELNNLPVIITELKKMNEAVQNLENKLNVSYNYEPVDGIFERMKLHQNDVSTSSCRLYRKIFGITIPLPLKENTSKSQEPPLIIILDDSDDPDCGGNETMKVVIKEEKTDTIIDKQDGTNSQNIIKDEEVESILKPVIKMDIEEILEISDDETDFLEPTGIIKAGCDEELPIKKPGSCISEEHLSEHEKEEEIYEPRPKRSCIRYRTFEHGDYDSESEVRQPYEGGSSDTSYQPSDDTDSDYSVHEWRRSTKSRRRNSTRDSLNKSITNVTEQNEENLTIESAIDKIMESTVSVVESVVDSIIETATNVSNTKMKIDQNCAIQDSKTVPEQQDEKTVVNMTAQDATYEAEQDAVHIDNDNNNDVVEGCSSIGSELSISRDDDDERLKLIKTIFPKEESLDNETGGEENTQNQSSNSKDFSLELTEEKILKGNRVIKGPADGNNEAECQPNSSSIDESGDANCIECNRARKFNRNKFKCYTCNVALAKLSIEGHKSRKRHKDNVKRDIKNFFVWNDSTTDDDYYKDENSWLKIDLIKDLCYDAIAENEQESNITDTYSKELLKKSAILILGGSKHTMKYKCFTCDVSYNTKANLRDHIRDSRLHKRLVAWDMRKSLYFKQNLLLVNPNITELSITNGVEIMCRICSKTMRKLDVVEHFKGHVECNTSKCKICFKKFIFKSSLTNHNKSSYHDDFMECERLSCAPEIQDGNIVHYHKFLRHTCGKTGSRGCSFENEKGIEYVCHICDRVFSRRVSLRMHLNCHSEDSKRDIYKCHVCSKVMKKYSQFEKHLELHDEKPYRSCPFCFESSMTTKAIFAHLKQVHKKTYRNVDFAAKKIH